MFSDYGDTINRSTHLLVNWRFSSVELVGWTWLGILFASRSLTIRWVRCLQRHVIKVSKSYSNNINWTVLYNLLPHITCVTLTMPCHYTPAPLQSYANASPKSLIWPMNIFKVQQIPVFPYLRTMNSCVTSTSSDLRVPVKWNVVQPKRVRNVSNYHKSVPSYLETEKKKKRDCKSMNSWKQKKVNV